MFGRRTAEHVSDSPMTGLLRQEIEILKPVPQTRTGRFLAKVLGPKWLPLDEAAAYRWMETLSGLHYPLDSWDCAVKDTPFVRLVSGDRGARIDINASLDDLGTLFTYDLSLPLGKRPRTRYKITEDDIFAPIDVDRFEGHPDESHLAGVFDLIHSGIRRS